MNDPVMQELLRAVWQYLFDRGVPVEILTDYEICVNRENWRIYLGISDTCIDTQIFYRQLKIRPKGPQFDLNDPNSLQEIFEYLSASEYKVKNE